MRVDTVDGMVADFSDVIRSKEAAGRPPGDRVARGRRQGEGGSGKWAVPERCLVRRPERLRYGPCWATLVRHST